MKFRAWFYPLLLLASSSTTASDVIVDQSTVTALYSSSASQKYTGHRCVARETCFDFEFQVTSKGNGLLVVPGVSVRIYDVHGDGWVFDNGLLRAHLGDINSDGFLDLIVEGTGIELNEDGDVAATESIYRQFPYQPENRCFLVGPEQDEPILVFASPGCDEQSP